MVGLSAVLIFGECHAGTKVPTIKKVEDMQKADSNSSDGYGADNSIKVEDTSVSQHSRKTPVVGSQMSLSVKQKLDNKIKVYEWFYGELESLIKSTNLALNRSDNSITYLGSIKLSTPNDTNKRTKKGKSR